MRRVALLAVVPLLAACGGSPGAGATPTPSPTATSTQPAATLAETCPQLEAELMETRSDSLFPPPSEAEAMLEVVNRLTEAGDQETKTALGFMVDPLETLAADPEPGSDSIDALSAYDASILTVADRCQAVGSSAFQ